MLVVQNNNRIPNIHLFFLACCFTHSLTLTLNDELVNAFMDMQLLGERCDE